VFNKSFRSAQQNNELPHIAVLTANQWRSHGGGRRAMNPLCGKCDVIFSYIYTITTKLVLFFEAHNDTSSEKRASMTRTMIPNRNS